MFIQYVKQSQENSECEQHREDEAKIEKYI